MLIGIGARPAGLGETFTGLADDASALAYNPAGLAFLRRKELGLVHDALAPGVHHEWAGYAHPAPWGTLGAAANILFVTPFDAVDSSDRPLGVKTGAMDAAYQLSYALQIADSLALGGSGKFIDSRLYNYSARTYAADAGLLWRPRPRLRLGAALLHIGEGLRYLAQTDELPTMLRSGASWTPFAEKDFAHYFTLVADVVKPREEPVVVSGGVEFWYDGIFALRAGGRSGAPGPGFTLGAGFRLYHETRSRPELDIDYAFIDSGDFAQTHRVSLAVKFGKPLRDEPARARPSAEPTLSPNYKDWIKP